jgi:peptidoglycan/LPS O-acetylase OafA/YrhL
LDGLRFFAFLLVLIHHGPDLPYPFSALRGIGGFGLSIFFLLSAYLITELLLREREQTQDVSWRLFFLRRALRIWPLYFGVIAAMIAVWVYSRSIYSHYVDVSRSHLLEMIFFVVNWFTTSVGLGHLTTHLWSISVEEQFYLIWPPIMKFGGRTAILVTSLFFMAGAPVWMALFLSRGWKLWYDTPVEFLFFAAGALIAIGTHRGLREKSGLSRALLLTLSVVLLYAAYRFGHIGSDYVGGNGLGQALLGYGLAVGGCVSIFFAVIGFSGVPRWLAYLGKISYGLYVFHLATMHVSKSILSYFRIPEPIYAATADILATLLCIGVAHLSYQYFERPFLKIKERFAVVKSRPA